MVLRLEPGGGIAAGPRSFGIAFPCPRTTEAAGRPHAPRIAFLFNAQSHHIPHGLPMACELSRLFPSHEVHVLTRTAGQGHLARGLADAAYPGHRLRMGVLRRPALRALADSKLAVLLANRRLLAGFDALVLPERTSLILRRLGVTGPRFVHCFHGASGHDRADDPRLRRFDLLLAPSARRLERIAAAGPLPPGGSAVVGYGKLDLVRRLGLRRPSPFGNGRPTVLYNPHHRPGTSSWHAMGWQVLDFFAASPDLNLIFAPHVRLFDPPERHAAAFRRYAGCPNILLDLGSPAGMDMSHALAADIYLGDISSQVFEFLIRPRPCVFLDPHGLPWEGDPDFASWRLGPVVADVAAMARALATTAAWQPGYEAPQRAAFADAFPELDRPAPEMAARALVEFLAEGRLRDPAPPRSPVPVHDPAPVHDPVPVRDAVAGWGTAAPTGPR